MNEKKDIQLGDYRLLEVLSENDRILSYRAEQISIKRIVVLDRLRSRFVAQKGEVEQFLEDLKAKASVSHPRVALVYEAFKEGGYVFFTKELIVGESLAQGEALQKQRSPQDWFHILKQIGEVMQYFQENQVSTVLMELHHVFIDQKQEVRFVNEAIQAPYDPKVLEENKRLLGRVIEQRIQSGFPAESRLRALCHSMQKENDALDWAKIVRYCEEVKHALSVSSETSEESPKSVKNNALKTLCFVGLLLAAMITGVFFWNKGESTQNREHLKKRNLEQMVKIPKAIHLLWGGRKKELPKYWIDAHEVTIGEYAVFLEKWKHLSEQEKSALRHPEQPPNKKNYTPEDWSALWKAAQAGGIWEGQRLTVNHPVVNVDWWDAYTYAKWQGRRLPQQDEFLAAALAKGGIASAIIPSSWGAVDQPGKDISLNKIQGLAGNVREWMGDRSVNPAFPMNPAQWVIAGGSYQTPGIGVKTRVWIENRNERKKDVGFRTVSSVYPKVETIK